MAKTTTTEPKKPEATAPTSSDEAAAAEKSAREAAEAEKRALEAKAPAAPPSNAPGPTAVHYDRMNDVVKAAAKASYGAYIANSNGLNYEGKPCPKFEDLSLAVKSHWCASVLEMMVIARSQATSDALLLREANEALTRELTTARQTVLDAQEALSNARGTGVAPSVEIERLSRELRQCRNDLKRVAEERNEANRTLARVEASTKSSAQAAAASRTSMLETEVDKLRGELAKKEGELRVAAERCLEAETALKKLRSGDRRVAD